MATDIAKVVATLTSFYDFRIKSVVHVGAGGGQFVGYASRARHVVAIDPDAVLRHARTLAPETLVVDHVPESQWAWHTAEEEKAARSLAAVELAGVSADLLFLMVPVADDATLREGVYFSANRLSAKALSPMHARGREHVYTEFARKAASDGIQVPVHCAEFAGDHFAVRATERVPSHNQTRRTDREPAKGAP